MSDHSKSSQQPARERILLAAVNEFSQKGFEGASTSGIARKARVTQPLVHYHFETKDNLWRETVERSFSRVRAAIEPKDEGAEQSPREAFSMLIKRFVRFNARHPEFGRMILMEGGTAGPRLDWMIEDYFRPLYKSMRETIESGQGEGWVKDDLPADFVTFLLIGSIGLPYQMPETAQQLFDIDVQKESAIDRHAEVIAELFLRGLLTPA